MNKQAQVLDAIDALRKAIDGEPDLAQHAVCELMQTLADALFSAYQPYAGDAVRVLRRAIAGSLDPAGARHAIDDGAWEDASEAALDLPLTLALENTHAMEIQLGVRRAQARWAQRQQPRARREVAS